MKLKSDDTLNKLPEHLGIIMDGNGRWAKKRMLPRSAGHKQGAVVFRKIAKHCNDIGIKYLTVYAFSTENWKRPREEINAIMDLLREYLKEVYSHAEENGRIHFIGDTTPLDDDLREMIADVQERTKNRSGMTVNIALNYGGRDEIVAVTQAIAKEAIAGKISPEQIDKNMFESHLYTAGQPEVDCVIRPSGEMRISNFMLWQVAYAELIYLDVLWPDFSTDNLDKALEEYAMRGRRFGGVNDR